MGAWMVAGRPSCMGSDGWWNASMSAWIMSATLSPCSRSASAKRSAQRRANAPGRTGVRARAEQALLLACERDEPHGRVESHLLRVRMRASTRERAERTLAARIARAMASRCVVPDPSSSAPGARVEPQDPRES